MHNNKAKSYRNKFTNLTVDKYNSSYKFEASEGGLTCMGTVVYRQLGREPGRRQLPHIFQGNSRGWGSCPHHPKGVTFSGQSSKSSSPTDIYISTTQTLSQTQTHSQAQPHAQTQTQTQVIAPTTNTNLNTDITHNNTHHRQRSTFLQKNTKTSNPFNCQLTNQDLLWSHGSAAVKANF